MHFDMSVETFLTVLYCIVDELYQQLASREILTKQRSALGMPSIGGKPYKEETSVLKMI
jgi:hypothetical protein